MYRKLLNRIIEEDDTKTAFEILTWLLYAQRPLKTEELSEILVIEPRDTHLSDPTSPRDIVECCRGLVVWERASDTIRFTHETVKEFLKRLDSSLSPDKKALFLTSADIALRCLTYLNFDIFEDFREDETFVIDRMNRFKFSKYAAQFWAVHTRGKAEESEEVQCAVLRLLESENKKKSMLQIAGFTRSRFGRITLTKGQTPLHIIAEEGLTAICGIFLTGHTCIDRKYSLFTGLVNKKCPECPGLVLPESRHIGGGPGRTYPTAFSRVERT
jgi:hypothetical protein